MKTELRNCPFCNGDFVMAYSIGERKENFDEAEVYCATCGASIIRNCKHFSSQKSTDEAVIKHWNHRPIEDGLRAEIEKLKKELAEYKSDIAGYEETAGKVYYEITNGQFSKINTDPEYILEAAYKYFEAYYKEEGE